MLDENSIDGRAVVIGAGTMGGGIAAQLANAGWRVSLLDVSMDDAVAGLDRVRSARPPLLFVPDFADRITPSAIDDAGALLGQADWIVEAVAEKLAAKQSVLAIVDQYAAPAAVISSNTSGLGLGEMSVGRSAAFKRRFLGSHFLNPPRYLKLLEVIPTPETDSDVLAGFVRFAEQVLGHRVVVAKDTPGFISTRLGIWHLLDTIRLAIDNGIGIEQADLLTGALIGRPKSGTFRMADLVGLDILAAIGADQYERLPDDPFRDRYRLPEVVKDLIAAGRTGEKAGAGFYKRDGKSILAFDFETGDYRPKREPLPPVADGTLRLPLEARFAALDKLRDEPGLAFLGEALDGLARYVDYAGPLIADDVLAIDRVMTWGFGWEMGPYAMIDARNDAEFGPSLKGGESDRQGRLSHDRMGIGGADLTQRDEYRPPKEYVDGRYRRFSGGYVDAPVEPAYLTVAAIKRHSGAIVFDSVAASLVDMGEDVACLEFHTKMNTFSPALTAFVDAARERAERDFRALVIGNDAVHFSAGYNLNLFLQARALADWASIDRMLEDCQYAFMRLKYAPIPVVAAPHGYTLGAGCECSLHCDAIVAGPELFMGLPEASVGVVPAGGGTKEMLVRSQSTTPETDPFDALLALFDRLAFPRNSTSAEDARRLGFLRSVDCVSRNLDRRLFEARRRAVELAAGYLPPARMGAYVLGVEGHARLRLVIDERRAAGSISEHDAFMADRLGYILCGGNFENPQLVDEDYLLRLEREVFIEVVRHPKSAERLEHVLATGKPLKN